MIPESDFEIIRSKSHQVKYRKGEVIYRQGTRCSSLIFLHQGIVKFNYEYSSGKNFITTIVIGPKLLGGANLFFGDTCIFSIIAVEDCEVCHIDSGALMTVCMAHGNYVLALAAQMVNMFQASIFNFISLAHNQVYGRVADVLIYLHENVYNDGVYSFHLTRKELAEFAGCSHENMINSLSKLNKEGTIRFEGKEIIILDLPRLYQLSKNG